jgi:GntR family transcriptional regulator
VPVPDLGDPRPPYLQIADDLRRQIKVGRYQPGDRLPSLPAMSATYRSAAETVRRALGRLRDEGLVATQSTRGTFVLRTSPEPRPGDGERDFEAALEVVEARLIKHVDDEIAKLREELEYTQAQMLALSDQVGTAPAQRGETGR